MAGDLNSQGLKPVKLRGDRLFCPLAFTMSPTSYTYLYISSLRLHLVSIVPASDTKAHRDYIQKIRRNFSSSEATVDGGVNMSYKPIAPAPTGSNHTPPGEFHCALSSFMIFFLHTFYSHMG